MAKRSEQRAQFMGRTRTKKGMLGLTQMVAYASMGVPVYLVMMPLIVYLPTFYAQELGLGLTGIGAVFFVARVLDGMSDVVVGTLSDRTRHQWGRRKVWIAAGAPLMLLSLYLLCRPPAHVGIVYVATWLVCLYVAWTIVQVPYLSWGAELSPDYHERSRISAFREGAGMIAMLLATGGPFLLFGADDLPLGKILGFFLIAIAVLLPLSAGAALVLVPDKARSPVGSPSLRDIVRVMAMNRPFQRLITALLLIRAGASVFDASEIWLLTYWLKMPEAFLGILFMQYVCSVLFIPVTLKISRKFGKHKSLAFAILANFAYLSILAFVPPKSLALVIIAFLINAVGNAANWVVPTAMIADAVDYGKLKQRGGDSGSYMAVYTLAFKISLAIGVIVALPLLQLAGFSPSHPNTGLALLALPLVACLVPALLQLPALLMLWNYPLTEARHGRIRDLVDRRQAGRYARLDAHAPLSGPAIRVIPGA